MLAIGAPCKRVLMPAAPHACLREERAVEAREPRVEVVDGPRGKRHQVGAQGSPCAEQPILQAHRRSPAQPGIGRPGTLADVACCSVGCEASHPFSAKQLGTHAWAIPSAPRCSAGGLQRVLSARATAATKVLPLHARAPLRGVHRGHAAPFWHYASARRCQEPRTPCISARGLGLPQILHLHVPCRCLCLKVTAHTLTGPFPDWAQQGWHSKAQHRRRNSSSRATLPCSPAPTQRLLTLLQAQAPAAAV